MCALCNHQYSAFAYIDSEKKKKSSCFIVCVRHDVQTLNFKCMVNKHTRLITLDCSNLTCSLAGVNVYW